MNSSGTTDDVEKAHNVSRSALLALLSLGGIGYCVVVTAAMHFLRPDYNPVSRFVSEYVVGPYGGFAATGFFSLELGSLALLLGLAHEMSPAGRSKVGMALLAMWCAGLLVTGMFATDLKGAPPTPHGTVHTLAASLGFACFVPGVLLLSDCFRRDTRWRSVSRPGLALALLALASLIAYSLCPADLKGLTERVLLGTVIAWLGLVALKLFPLTLRFQR